MKDHINDNLKFQLSRGLIQLNDYRLFIDFIDVIVYEYGNLTIQIFSSLSFKQK